MYHLTNLIGGHYKTENVGEYWNVSTLNWYKSHEYVLPDSPTKAEFLVINPGNNMGKFENFILCII